MTQQQNGRLVGGGAAAEAAEKRMRMRMVLVSVRVDGPGKYNIYVGKKSINLYKSDICCCLLLHMFKHIMLYVWEWVCNLVAHFILFLLLFYACT